MMTLPVPGRSASPLSPLFTRASPSRPKAARSRSSRPQVSGSRPWADLAGRAVGLPPDVPVLFAPPLAAHHRIIGHWAAGREEADRLYSRYEARQRIEQLFEAAVQDILRPVDMANLRVAVMIGEDGLDPAIVIICDSIGQIDLGWIEKSNVLSNTLFAPVAPVGWQAAAYKALCGALPAVLPIFGYEDFMEEMSAMYWDGETTDEGARQALMDWHGAEAEDIAAEYSLPSEMHARRPGWMLGENARPLRYLPVELADAIRRVRRAADTVRSLNGPGNAWNYDSDLCHNYVYGYEDSSCTPPLTLVPFDHFQRELDYVCEHAMQTSFHDTAGICPLINPGLIDHWFASLRAGVDMLVAAQALIDLFPSKS